MSDLPDDRPALPLPEGPAERWRRQGPARILAFVALAGFLATLAVFVSLAYSHFAGSPKKPPPVTITAPPHTVVPTTAPPPPAPRPVPLAGVGAYDPPPGDGQENDSEAPLATDGDPATFWSTEHYTTWYKKGVGLVLDAQRPVLVSTLRIASDTPGFAAEVQAGSSPNGPFTRVSASKTIGASTVFRFHELTPARYVVIWVTRVGATPQAGGAAHVNEVHATD